MSKLLYPMQVTRTLSPRLWGGTKLLSYLGLPEEEGCEPIGESWEVFEENEINNGIWAGRSLSAVASELGADLLGTRSVEKFGARVPLLAKFIDAGQPLSIQVHPDDDYAKEREPETGFMGKEEAWLILETEPGSRVTWGFTGSPALTEVRRRIEDGSLEGLLRQVEVFPGDVILNPPGLVHAIGAGILLFEIQQSSDLTYRLYDYQRRDINGELRPLHVEQGLDVMTLHTTVGPKVTPGERPDGWTELVGTENFVLLSKTISKGCVADTSTTRKSLEVLTVTEGIVWIRTPDFQRIELNQGESAILPAKLGAYQLGGTGRVLRAGVVL
jgi:mannose-6-phosphate isomerase